MQDTTRRWPVIAESDGEWHWQWTDELTDATESQRLSVVVVQSPNGRRTTARAAGMATYGRSWLCHSECLSGAPHEPVPARRRGLVSPSWKTLLSILLLNTTGDMVNPALEERLLSQVNSSVVRQRRHQEEKDFVDGHGEGQSFSTMMVSRPCYLPVLLRQDAALTNDCDAAIDAARPARSSTTSNNVGSGSCSSSMLSPVSYGLVRFVSNPDRTL